MGLQAGGRILTLGLRVEDSRGLGFRGARDLAIRIHELLSRLRPTKELVEGRHGVPL